MQRARENDEPVAGGALNAFLMSLVSDSCLLFASVADFEQRKRPRDGLDQEENDEDHAGDTFVKKLHARLSRTTAQDAIYWVEGGARFKVRPASQATLQSWFGASSQAFRQTLESLNFQCREERPSGELYFSHSEFSKCKLPSIKELLEHNNSDRQDSACQERMHMPAVSYNPMLNPLEVRVKCSKAAASQSESWEVVIASSLQPGMPFSERVASYFLQEEEEVAENDTSTPPGVDLLYFDLERPPCYSLNSQERESESYNWTGRPSESSSICMDDFTDIDILSQISAYYG